MGTLKEKFDGYKPHFTAKVREYTLTYIVHGTCTTNDFPKTMIWNCKGFSDPYARFVSADNFQQLSATVGEIDAHYSTELESQKKPESEKDQPSNPLSRTIKRRWSTGYMEMYPPADLSTPPKPFKASNGEPISGGIAIKVPYLILSYTRNEAFFNETKALEMILHMDPSKKILCTRFDGSETQYDEHSNVSFVEVSYEFWKLGNLKVCDQNITWDEMRLDAGSFSLTNQLDENGNRKPRFLTDKDETKAYANNAILLDGNGGVLQTTTPKWNTFTVCETAALSSLGLPGI